MDPTTASYLTQLSDKELLTRVKQLAERERKATTVLIAHLAEIDKRRLYLPEGYSSLFAYCTQALHLSEHAAYNRIEAARLFQKFPLILDLIEDGSMNLTTARLLASYLTQENHQEVLEAARNKTKRQVEELIAQLHPRPAVPSMIRKLPTARDADAKLPAEHHTEPVTLRLSDIKDDAALQLPNITPPLARPAVVLPLAPERYKVQFTANAETYQKLRMAQNLVRHRIPNGDLAAIFDLALTALLQNLAEKKLAATNRPRATREQTQGSRHIPASVKRAVWIRDGGRCTFVAQNSRRCNEEGFVEFHHVTPYAAGGRSTVDNIELRCRAHNSYEAELDFGLSVRRKQATT